MLVFIQYLGGWPRTFSLDKLVRDVIIVLLVPVILLQLDSLYFQVTLEFRMTNRVAAPSEVPSKTHTKKKLVLAFRISFLANIYRRRFNDWHFTGKT